ncbi:pilus (MSHA type) biogenesis protein MshL [Pseudidiomarina aestuarii]|uniref:pilus (MSHA type) biogenesis protein MshL n=1 Tax=Pseudidiomarina aestuarii TaxID=624146 RepID=UPI003A96E3B6
MRLLTCTLMSLLLTACAYSPDREPAELHRALESGTQTPQPKTRPPLPDSVRAAIQGSRDSQLQAQGEALLAEPRFSVSANNVSAPDFFAGLAADSPYNIVLHPDVSGSITVSLKDVTLQETLAVVSDIYGYDIRQENRMIRIFPSGLRSQTFTFDYLSMQRSGSSSTSISNGGVRENDRNQSNQGTNTNTNNRNLGNEAGGNNNNNQNSGGSQANGSSISSSSSTDFWGEIEQIIEGIIGDGDGRRVVSAPQAGLITVTALPQELRAVGDFLANAQERLQRQVILEARIVEVSLNDEYQQGINWSDLFRIGNATGTIGFSGSAIAAPNGVFGMSLDVGDFSGVLNLLQTQGNVQVLSNPRISASNNQKAVIKIGEDEYFVTNVSTTTVTGTATTSTPNVELTPFFSGISLDITPQISDSQTVTLHVHPSVVQTTAQERVVKLQDDTLVLPLAQSNIRESDTIVTARNGEVVVLGGLMQSNYTESETKAPLLGDVPVLGNLFKNKQRRETKKELVILIRPIIVGADSWNTELERSSDLLKQWYGN